MKLQPTGENGATRAPISIELNRDTSLSSKSIILQIDNKTQQVSASKTHFHTTIVSELNYHVSHPLALFSFLSVGALRHSLQDRLSKGSSGRSRDEIYLKLRTSTGKPIIIFYVAPCIGS